MGGIKIISDGTGFGTRVVDEATGEPITNITRVEWVVAADGVAMANLRAIKVPLEVVGDAKVIDVCLFDRDQKCNPTPERWAPVWKNYQVELTPGVDVPRPTVKPLEFSPTAFVLAVPEVDFRDKPAKNPAEVLAELTGEPVDERLKAYCDELVCPHCAQPYDEKDLAFHQAGTCAVDLSFSERLNAFKLSSDEKLRHVIKGITTEAQARRAGRWQQHLDAHCGEAMCSTPCRRGAEIKDHTNEPIDAPLSELTITVNTPGIKEHFDTLAGMTNAAITQGMALAGRMDKAREALNLYGENPTPEKWIALCEIISPNPTGSRQ